MESKAPDTLEKIQQTALDEFLEKGFLGASLRQIVKHAGVTTGAFYGYFSSPVFRRSTRKFPSFSSCHFFISFPASRFFLYLQQIFNALLGLFLLKKFF